MQNDRTKDDLAALRKSLKREHDALRRDIQLDAIYLPLLQQHVFKDPEPLAAMTTGWTVSPEFAWWLFQYVRAEQPNLVIELGSGVSTVVIASALEKNSRGRLLAFEHEQTYLAKTAALLQAQGLADRVDLVYAPLRTYRFGDEAFRWYDIPWPILDTASAQCGAELLLVDGPPKATGDMARYPAHPLLKRYFAPSTCILLDDAGREEEQRIAARWREEDPGLGRMESLSEFRHRPLRLDWTRHDGLEQLESVSNQDALTAAVESVITRAVASRGDADFDLATAIPEIARALHVQVETRLSTIRRELTDARDEAMELQKKLSESQVSAIRRAEEDDAKRAAYEKVAHGLRKGLSEARELVVRQALESETLRGQLEELKLGVIEAQGMAEASRGEATDLRAALADMNSSIDERDHQIETLRDRLRRAYDEINVLRSSLSLRFGTVIGRNLVSPAGWIRMPVELVRAYRNLPEPKKPPLPSLARKRPKREGQANKGAAQSQSSAVSTKESVGRARLYGDYLSIADRKPPFALDATILRNDSLNGRELVIWRASHGRLDERGLTALLEHARAPQYAETASLEIRTRLDPEWAVRFARILIVQQAQLGELVNGLDLVSHFLGIAEAEPILRRFGLVFFDAAVAAGRRDLAQALITGGMLRGEARKRATLDLSNPWEGDGDQQEWLMGFNRHFIEHGLEPLALIDDDTLSPFDRVICDTPAGSVEGPLVSIIVTAFNPDQGLLTSIRSLLAQTYRNIEILLVDDASDDPDSIHWIDESVQLDSRIRLLRQPENCGTYVARNAGLMIAQGEFVTGQDADDWSHPHRIEKQVSALRTDPKAIANQSSALFVSSSLRFASFGRKAIDVNASSLMFRREVVLERLGRYDTVRKAADNELVHRCTAAFGQPISRLEFPLALIRRNDKSLSRGDFKPGWRASSRSMYRRAYLYWHNLIRLGETSPRLDGDLSSRPFPAPRSYLPRKFENHSVYDVIFVGDWVSRGGPQNSMLQEIKVLQEKGMKMAICNMEPFRFMRSSHSEYYYPPIAEFLYAGKVEEVLPCDTLRARLVLLRYPPILQFTQRQPFAWKIDRAFVVANQAPSEEDGADLRYLVADCVRNARQLFGVDPLWMPQGPLVRRAIEPLLPSNLLVQRDNPGIIDPAEWSGTRRKRTGTQLRIGRYSRDTDMKFPDSSETMLKIYPSEGDFVVDMMGGIKTVPKIFGGDSHVPSGWLLRPYGSVSPRDFLDSIDVFVYFDHTTTVEAFGRSILEAMAGGCAVVLPEKFQEVFGAGPVYCAPEEVREVLERMRTDRAFFDSVREQTLSAAKERFGYDSFSQWISVELNHLADK
ncbi:glycosyltransferase [Thiocapsa marina]|uniref:Glycosyl transferase family 2 n=1 Tax=Thiocapsa marina 5811 TaxID=768671 RepID=F9UIK3_9GAMM|nr:glycosyltransferase [Thiocapsa marina]EGV15957.1 glycosyl transferase family 2 [Thiocapsa marina 5811]